MLVPRCCFTTGIKIKHKWFFSCVLFHVLPEREAAGSGDLFSSCGRKCVMSARPVRPRPDRKSLRGIRKRQLNVFSMLTSTHNYYFYVNVKENTLIPNYLVLND